MHFDQRTQRALREADLTTEEIESVSELVELTLGPTVHDQVRFAPDPERL